MIENCKEYLLMVEERTRKKWAIDNKQWTKDILLICQLHVAQCNYPSK